jgi:hypothetical protein
MVQTQIKMRIIQKKQQFIQQQMYNNIIATSFA